LRVTIPANTMATVFVPAPQAARVTESGQPAAESPGVRWLRLDGKRAVFEASGGQYSFMVRK
jgi:alpha-L-rhamnosidase